MSAICFQSSICFLITERAALCLFHFHSNDFPSTAFLSRVDVARRGYQSLPHNFLVMPHQDPSHSTLEARNPERALYDSYKEVSGQVSSESPQLLALKASARNTLKPQLFDNAELPTNVRGGARKEPRTSKSYSARRNHVAVACLGVALAGIITTIAVIGMKTSQHGWSHSSTSSVAASSVSTRLSSSRGQMTSRLETTATLKTETPSVKLNTVHNLSSATIDQSQDSATLKSSSVVSRQESLPNSKSSILLSTTSNISKDTQTRAVADSSHVAATPVLPVDSSFDQTSKAQPATTYSKLSDTSSGAQASSNTDQVSTTTSLTSSTNSPQPTTSIESSRPKFTSTVNVRTVTALDQLAPTNCLQSSDIWKGSLTVDSPDTC